MAVAAVASEVAARSRCARRARHNRRRRLKLAGASSDTRPCWRRSRPRRSWSFVFAPHRRSNVAIVAAGPTSAPAHDQGAVAPIMIAQTSPRPRERLSRLPAPDQTQSAELIRGVLVAEPSAALAGPDVPRFQQPRPNLVCLTWRRFPNTKSRPAEQVAASCGKDGQRHTGRKHRRQGASAGGTGPNGARKGLGGTPSTPMAIVSSSWTRVKTRSGSSSLARRIF